MKGYYPLGLTIFLLITFAYANSDELTDGLDVETRGSSWMPSWARPYTQSKTGCPCWWDLLRGNDCACCKDNGNKVGVPCGYPLHMYCQNQRNRGCPGNKKSFSMRTFVFATLVFAIYYVT